ncbi:MAG: hypothetical protein DSM106950_44930 [Stigonema ocellatum SAG 48.90 = DSM 106950]|nr:hypothetical protein [Stigonema ocellatum SAG 48.90 = DSM 106950]
MEEARKISQEIERGKKWQDVPKELIEKLGDSFGFLDPKGFRYYLPAFMIYSLQNYSSGYVFIDSVYFALANQTRYYQKYQKHLALLNQEHLEVAQEYVSFIKTYSHSFI